MNYPTITCHLIISNDNDFKNKRENGASMTLQSSPPSIPLYLVSQAEAIPLALFASPCSSLLVLLATSYWLQCCCPTIYVLKSAISYQILAEDPWRNPLRQRASDNRIAPCLSQADVRSRHNTLAPQLSYALLVCQASTYFLLNDKAFLHFAGVPDCYLTAPIQHQCVLKF